MFAAGKPGAGPIDRLALWPGGRRGSGLGRSNHPRVGSVTLHPYVDALQGRSGVGVVAARTGGWAGGRGDEGV
jgi:hypothetical protein